MGLAIDLHCELGETCKGRSARKWAMAIGKSSRENRHIGM